MKWFLIALLLIPTVAATHGGPDDAWGATAGSYTEVCDSHTTGNVAGFISQGTVEFCLRFPNTINEFTQDVYIDASLNGPTITAVGMAVITMTTTDLIGCNRLSLGSYTDQSALAGFGIQISQLDHLSITDEVCAGMVFAQIDTSTGTRIYGKRLAFTINAAGDNPVKADNINRFCDASAFEETCLNDWATIALALTIFVLVILWAEIKRESELYLLAVITGAFEVLFFWPSLSGQIRTLLILVTAFLGWRLYDSAQAKEGS